jgi:hypothetical protein
MIGFAIASFCPFEFGKFGELGPDLSIVIVKTKIATSAQRTLKNGRIG